MRLKTRFRWVALVALSLFLFDMVQDMPSACATPGDSASSCHACVCGPHIAPTPVSGRAVSVASPSSSLERDVFLPFLRTKDIFHPPKSFV